MKFSELVKSYETQDAEKKTTSGGKFSQLVSEYETNPNRWEEYSAQKQADAQAAFEYNKSVLERNEQARKENAFNSFSSDLNAKNMEKYGTTDPLRIAVMQGGEQYAARKTGDDLAQLAQEAVAAQDNPKLGERIRNFFKEAGAANAAAAEYQASSSPTTRSRPLRPQRSAQPRHRQA